MLENLGCKFKFTKLKRLPIKSNFNFLLLFKKKIESREQRIPFSIAKYREVVLFLAVEHLKMALWRFASK